jgi:glutamate formiminotransferase/formiminotetrahydrofolate cyclodeaminase
MKLVECVPNFSEGRNPATVTAIRDAIAAVDGVAVLDVSSDASHNRSVITFVVPVDQAVEAALAGVREAAARIDLTRHAGEHPRIGATDVVPFIPLEGSTIEDCIALAQALGRRVAEELGIPVYLYERAATMPTRENLADVRRGEFEGLGAEIATNPARHPDFGEPRLHPTAGATAIGARPFLVAYNVYLGGRENLQIAKDVAKAVRGSSGGLRFVKGLGLEVDGQAQVSMNLVDLDKTPLYRAYDMVQMEGEARGVTPTWSEIVGLVPEQALFETAARHLRLRGFTPEMVLERKVRDAIAGGESLASFVASVAAPTPAPGGGAVAAHVASLGAALVQMVAGLTIGRKKYAGVDAEMREIAQEAAAAGTELSRLAREDAAAYGVVMEAYRLPKESDEQQAARQAAIEQGLIGAAKVPLETARVCMRVARSAARVAEIGNANAVSDAGVAALLAEAGCRAASYNVQINVASLSDRAAGRALMADVTSLMDETSRHAQAAAAAVQRAMSSGPG